MVTSPWTFVYLCLAWTVGPSVVPLYVCLGLGRLLPFGEDLVDRPTKWSSSDRQPWTMVYTLSSVEIVPNFMLDLPIFSPTDDLGNAHLSLFDLKISCLQIRWLPYRLNLWLAYRFCLEVCLIHLQPSHVSGCLSVLVSCCCSTWSDLMIIFHLVITLVDARRVWNLNKNLILSCLWQLIYVLLCYALTFRSPPCWL